MSETTKIIWSGLTGRTGRAAIPIAAEMTDVEIVAGISRADFSYVDMVMKVLGNATETMSASTRLAMRGLKWYQYAMLNNPFNSQPKGFDVVVDSSNAEVFGKVLEFAVRTGKPLVNITSGLSDGQIASLYDATNCIPVFRGGNCRFTVKKFADQAVEFAKKHNQLILTEQHWIGQPLPTESALMIGRRILHEVGKTPQIVNGSPYGTSSYINEWILSGDDSLELNIACKVAGFTELAHDILEIAKVMANKPVKKGEFYDLDEIWSDIPESAKTTV